MSTVLLYDGNCFKFEKIEDDLKGAVLLQCIKESALGAVAIPCIECDIYKVSEKHIYYNSIKIEIPERYQKCYCDISTQMKLI